MFAALRRTLEAKEEPLGTLWVDEDPDIFRYVIDYLTNCGQSGVARLLPSDTQERERLRSEYDVGLTHSLRAINRTNMFSLA